MLKTKSGFTNLSTLSFFAGLGLLIAITIYTFVASLHWNQDVSGHLEQAANANTVEMAIPVLKKAISEIERRGTTNGNTSLFFKTPGNDIGYWYQNIKAAETELENLPKDSSQMEKSNVLLKLRETLVEHGEKGEKIVQPSGISRYPYNMLYFLFTLVGFGLVLPLTIRHTNIFD